MDLNKVTAGQRITAASWNEIVSALNVLSNAGLFIDKGSGGVLNPLESIRKSHSGSIESNQFSSSTFYGFDSSVSGSASECLANWMRNGTLIGQNVNEPYAPFPVIEKGVTGTSKKYVTSQLFPAIVYRNSKPGFGKWPYVAPGDSSLAGGTPSAQSYWVQVPAGYHKSGENPSICAAIVAHTEWAADSGFTASSSGSANAGSGYYGNGSGGSDDSAGMCCFAILTPFTQELPRFAKITYPEVDILKNSGTWDGKYKIRFCSIEGEEYSSTDYEAENLYQEATPQYLEVDDSGNEYIEDDADFSPILKGAIVRIYEKADKYYFCVKAPIRKKITYVTRVWCEDDEVKYQTETRYVVKQ